MGRTSKCDKTIKQRRCGYVLVIVFGAADVRLVLLHRVELNLADGAWVAFQRGSCSHNRRKSGHLILGWRCAAAWQPRSDLGSWPGRTSPSASSLSSVFCASCRRSAAGPWADCWRTPGTWSRSGWSRCCRRRPQRRRNPLPASSWAVRLLLLERPLETDNDKKMLKVLIFVVAKLERQMPETDCGYTRGVCGPADFSLRFLAWTLPW